MEFEQRLQQAIQRGQQMRDSRAQAQEQSALTEEQLRSIHSATRLELSERIEAGLRRLADHFPGFGFETVVGDDGWGARIHRDDLKFNAGRRESQYSRFQILVKPYSSQVKIIDVAVKGTIRNREIISRNQYQFLAEVSVERLQETIDMWIIEFAEQFAARV